MAFSIAIFFLGISAAFLGRYIERKGASKGGLLSAVFFSTGLIGSAAACWYESLPLFYLFFGVVSGIGLGLGYISPVSTLVKWFPDRRGLATGLAIMGFGFGGLICANLIDKFVPIQEEIVLAKEIQTYDYLQLKASNPQAATAMTVGTPSLESYKQQSNEAAELYRLNQTESAEYAALKATTDTYRATLIYDKKSIATAFLFLGIIYFCVMVPSALYISTPPAEYDVKFVGTDRAK